MKHRLLIILAIALVGEAFSQSTQNAERLKGSYMVVAHRGDWRNHPENSLPAIQSCIDKGYDVVEIDIQRTLDSVLVLSHDETLDRTTNGHGRICDHTLAELQQLRLKAGHGACTTRNRIPTLEEVLILCKGKILINIDKGWDYFDQVCDLLEKTGTAGQVIIKSRVSLERLQREHPTILSRVIYMPIANIDWDESTAFVDAWMSKYNNEAESGPAAFEVDFASVNDNVLRNLKVLREAGIPIWMNALWPSQNAAHDDDRAVELHEPDESWGWLLAQGATIIQTDRPAELKQYLLQFKN